MTNIIILHQTHSSERLLDQLELARRESDLPPDIFDEFYAVAESQFNIAQYIGENRQGVGVIHEHQPAYKSGDDTKLEVQARQLFPRGLPSRFQDLNYPQKAFIAYYGGSISAVSLGYIKEIYSDDLDSQAQQKLLTQGMNPEALSDLDLKFQAGIFQQREYLTLKNAINTAKRKNLNTILLPYGPLHPFTDVAQCFPDAKVKVIDKSVRMNIASGWDETIHAFEINRPELHCPTLQLGFNRPFLAPTETQANQLNYVGAAFLGALGIFGIYKWWSQRGNNVEIPQSKNDEPASTQTNVSKTNHQRRKRR